MQQPQEPRSRLTRDVRNKMIGGVCAGIAKQYGYDVTVVRVVTVLLTLVWGAGIILYLALWAIMPAEETSSAGDTSTFGTLGAGTPSEGAGSGGGGSAGAASAGVASASGLNSGELAERARRAADDFAIAARSTAEAARVAAEQLAEVAKAATAAGKESWEQQRAAREPQGASAGAAGVDAGRTTDAAQPASPPPPETPPPSFEMTPPPGPNDVRE